MPSSTPPPPRTGAAVLTRCGHGCDPAVAGAADQELAARDLEEWVDDAADPHDREARQELRVRVDAFLRAYDTRVDAER